MKRRILIVLGLLVLVPLLAVGGLAGFLLMTAHEPADVEPVAVEPGAGSGGLAAGRPFSIVSWNVQFGAGKTERFFYSGGTRVHATKAEMEAAMPALEQAVAAMAPDVLLLQEMDRHSARTLYIDEFPRFMAAGGFASGVSAPYHRARFVPSPIGNPLGEVDMHLAIMARGPLQAAERIQLALLKENPVVQAANLKRALLTAEIPIEGHPQPLALAVTHLSAFSRGDGTLTAQVDRLVEWIEARPEGQPWVLAGDFNLLPPGFDKSTLPPDTQALYADAVNPLERLIPKYRTVIADHLAPESATYVAVGAEKGDRKIDYVFVGGPIEVLEAEVVARYHALSDHLPIRARLVVGPAAEAAPAAEATPTDAPPSP